MLIFSIVIGALFYFLLLGFVFLFFSAVNKMNRHWERVFRDSLGEHFEHWNRAA